MARGREGVGRGGGSGGGEGGEGDSMETHRQTRQVNLPNASVKDIRNEL